MWLHPSVWVTLSAARPLGSASQAMDHAQADYVREDFNTHSK